jgi:ferritin-like metal-binding protein YciE
MVRAEDTGKAAEGAGYEKVWAMFQEIAERQVETDKQINELSKAADRRQTETDKQMRETDRIVKELSKNIGGLNNVFGKWAEELVSAKLWEKFNGIGYRFTRGGPMKFWEGGRTVAQVDILLENGDYAMPVEIKSELSIGDVDVHIERIEKVRGQLDKRGDKRKLVGAMAGMVAPEGVRKYAQGKGLYVLEQPGIW